MTLIRRAMACAAVVVLAALVSGCASGGKAAACRPSFVFVLVDDLRHDAMSCAGHPFVKTPNIDRIAAEGVRFANAFVTTSLCSPSRASFLTGTYAHRHGVIDNRGRDFDPALPTFARQLQQAGYRTGFVGKWHMKPTAQPRPGFDYWLSFRGQGEYLHPKLNENGRDFAAEGYMTDLLTKRATDFIRDAGGRPFCLCVWHKAVHEPFLPAERHKSLYADARMPEPASWRDTLAGKPRWQRARNPKKREAQAASQPVLDSLPPETWDPAAPRRMDYFRALAAVDESVGELFRALRDTGALERTVIVFAGDNGFFHGEHRMGDKRAAYEESIRIPLLMCGPGVQGPARVIDGMALNIDVAPTMLDLAGVTPAATMQGVSQRAVLAGRPSPTRTSFLYEYWSEPISRVPDTLGVRTERWKYVRYPAIDDLDEMYDLQSDPHEMRNLAGEPAFATKRAALRQELERLMKETGYVSPAATAVAEP